MNNDKNKVSYLWVKHETWTLFRPDVIESSNGIFHTNRKNLKKQEKNCKLNWRMVLHLVR